MADTEQPLAIKINNETPIKSLTPDESVGLYLSLNEASRQSKVPKGTISKDAAKGKIQWHERPDGTRKLHAAEVFNFYSDRIRREETGNSAGNSVSITNIEQHLEQEIPLKTAVQLAEAKAEIRFLREARANDAEQIKDLREQRDKLMENNHRLTHLLTAPTPAPAPEPEQLREKPTPPLSFWQRLFPSAK